MAVSLSLLDSWITSSFCVFAAAIVFFALIPLFVPLDKVPSWFQCLLLYGKTLPDSSRNSLFCIIQIPKGYFKHFYWYSVLCNSTYLVLMINTFVRGNDPPPIFGKYVNDLQRNRQPLLDAGSVMLVNSMMLLHSSRRMYESFSISVYSKGRMNILHFFMGIFLYGLFGSCLLMDGPPLKQVSRAELLAQVSSWRHLVAVLVWLFGNWQQNRAGTILGNLRKKDGKVITTGHFIPRGGMFDLVSNPHYTCEMLIYLGFLIIAPTPGVISVVIFVYSNQIIAGLLQHKWYLENFKEKYPKQRKAVIPYLL